LTSGSQKYARDISVRPDFDRSRHVGCQVRRWARGLSVEGGREHNGTTIESSAFLIACAHDSINKMCRQGEFAAQNLQSVTRASEPASRKNRHDLILKYSSPTRKSKILRHCSMSRRSPAGLPVRQSTWSAPHRAGTRTFASGKLPLTFLDSYELVRVKKSKSRKGT